LLRRLGLALAALAVLTGAQAAPASAEGEPDSGAFNAFNLKASNGYRIVVLAVSDKGYRNGQVLVLVGRKRQGVTYFAPAKVTDTSVEADLGAFGEIDVTFQPSGERGVAHPVCDRSQRATYDKGSYVGTIDLHGEEGYTRARTTSAPFTLHPLIDFVCSGSSETWGRGLPGARLRAQAKFGEGEAIEIQANQNSPGARVRVSATTKERRDRIHIFREISFTYPATALDWTPNLGTATLAPPAPFSGVARYRRNAKPGNQWTGNLEADFPGRSDVSLTGARFDPSLVHARFTKGTIHRDRPNLLAWPSTKLLPIASATSSPPALR
jgi:hypothetical protein